MSRNSHFGGIARRDLLRAGFGSLVLGASDKLWRSLFWAQAAAAQAERDGRILVIVELSGGNDGLNTVVPYGNDAYYRERPRLGIKAARLMRWTRKGTPTTLSTSTPSSRSRCARAGTCRSCSTTRRNSYAQALPRKPPR